MKRHWLSVIVMVGLSSGALAQQAERQAPPVLTLAAALEQSLQHGEPGRASLEGVEHARLGLRLARSAFGPKFTPTALGSFGQSDVSNQSYGLNYTQRFTTGTEVRGTLGAVTALNQLGNYYSSDVTLAVSQPLTRGFGGVIGRRELASAEERVTDALRQQTLAGHQLALEVAAAYYRIVTHRELVDVAQQSLERARQLLAASTAKLAAGRVSQLDVLRAEQLVAQADLQLLDATAGVADAQDHLRLLMNRGPEFEFEVDRTAPAGVDETMTVDTAITLALQRRLEIQIASAAVAEAERALTIANVQARPQVDVGAAVTRRETAGNFSGSFGLDQFRLVSFAAVSMPFERTGQFVAREQAAIALDQQRRAFETARLRVGQEARRALRQRDRLIQGLAIADAHVAFATQELDLATLRHQRGLSNNLDVVNAESNLLGARSQRLTMLAELALARLQLRAAVGTLDPRRDVR